jgi:hypothetical protein
MSGMQTFEIVSWVLGYEQKIIVTEPKNLDEVEFRLKLKEGNLNDDLIIKLEDGHWKPVSLINEIALPLLTRQFEIDSIGYKIAKHWCRRLQIQLENYQVCM